MTNYAQVKPLSTLALRQRRKQLLRTLKVPAPLIHASLVERYMKCGQANCACQQGQRHGPYYCLHRCMAQNRMQSLLLKNETQIAQARQSVAAYQQLLSQLDQLSWLNWELLRRGETLSHG